jgi:hypothetical protein
MGAWYSLEEVPDGCGRGKDRAQARKQQKSVELLRPIIGQASELGK